MKKTPVIKFSHYYKKFQGVITLPGKAILLIAIMYSDKIGNISQAMIEYDTKFAYGNGYYPLPKEELIVLLFKSLSSGLIFPTIRRYTPEKYDYYSNLEGETFDVLLENEEKK